MSAGGGRFPWEMHYRQDCPSQAVFRTATILLVAALHPHDFAFNDFANN